MKKMMMIIAAVLMASVAAQADLTWRGDLNGENNGGVLTVGGTEAGWTGIAVARTSTGRTNGTFSLTMANVDGGPVSSNMIFRQSLNVGVGGQSNTTAFVRNLPNTALYTNLYRDGFQVSATNSGSYAVVSFENLNPNSVYKVSLWAYDYSFGDLATQKFFNATGGGNTSIGDIAFPANSAGGAALPDSLTDYMVTADLTTDSTGAIVIQYYSIGKTGARVNAKLNAFEVVAVAVPEPATVGMLGLGALVTLVIRRMKR